MKQREVVIPYRRFGPRNVDKELPLTLSYATFASQISWLPEQKYFKNDKKFAKTYRKIIGYFVWLHFGERNSAKICK
jgi:hypothetical protein